MYRYPPLIALGGALASVAVAAPAGAQAGAPLSIETAMFVEQRVRAADGTTVTRMVPPRGVVPGTPVRIVVTYRNTGTQPLSGVAITNPVPANTSFRGGAPGAAQPEVSLDGRHFAPLGSIAGAASADVTAVRWRLAAPLTAGAKGQLAFTAVVK